MPEEPEIRSRVIESLSEGAIAKEDGTFIDNGNGIYFVGKETVYRFSELGGSKRPLTDYLEGDASSE